MNTVMPNLGGSVSGQVGAGTVVDRALPTEHGFTVAFILAAVACGRAAPAKPGRSLAAEAA